jgi:hypothetical protein
MRERRIGSKDYLGSFRNRTESDPAVAGRRALRQSLRASNTIAKSCFSHFGIVPRASVRANYGSDAPPLNTVSRPTVRANDRSDIAILGSHAGVKAINRQGEPK